LTKINLAARKKSVNLAFANAANVRISRIIHKEVVPDNKAARLKDSEHLYRNSVLHLKIENRSKNRGL